MLPIDIFITNSYSSSVIGTRDYSDIQPKIDYYASLPPPPPYTSSLYTTVDDRKQNFPIDQLHDPYGTNEALVSLQNVKDYLLRIQSLSPMHDAISPTDKNTDIKSNPINNFNTPSSVHDTQPNTMITDFSINEGLERIGTTLQQLIDEAQASLSGIPLEKSSPPPPPPLPPSSEEEEEEEEESTSQGFANYSYQYVQKRYMQSQEKISVAFEQLEQSIQSMTFTTTTKSHNSRKKPFLHYSKYMAVFGTITTIVVMLLSKYQKHAKPYKTMSILLFIISLYLKSISKESTIINRLDKFIIRMLFSWSP